MSAQGLSDIPCATVPFRRSGRSGLHLPSLSISLTDRIPGYGDGLSRVRWLEHAMSWGAIHFDISTPYGADMPSIHTELGVLRRQHHELLISTRVGFATHCFRPPEGFASRKCILSALEMTLRHTGLDCVDILFAHRHDPATPLEETMGALASAVQQGKAVYVGLSGYAPAPARRALALLRDLGVAAVACQAPYSLVNRWPEDGLFDVLRTAGAGLIACAPLAHGTLSGYRTALSPASEVSDTAYVSLSQIAASRGQTLPQLALSWVLRDSNIASALVSVSRLPHLNADCQAAGATNFAPEELDLLDVLCPAPPHLPFPCGSRTDESTPAS